MKSCRNVYKWSSTCNQGNIRLLFWHTGEKKKTADNGRNFKTHTTGFWMHDIAYWTDQQRGKVLFSMREAILWLVILDIHIYGEIGDHKSTPQTLSKGTCLEMTEFLFAEVPVLILRLTFTPSKKVLWLVSAITLRFLSHKFVCYRYYRSLVSLRGWQRFT